MFHQDVPWDTMTLIVPKSAIFQVMEMIARIPAIAFKTCVIIDTDV